MVKEFSYRQITGHNFQVHFLFVSYIHPVKYCLSLLFYTTWSKIIHSHFFSNYSIVQK